MKQLVIEGRPFKIKVSKNLIQSQKELDWYFQEGEAALGIKSNFDTLIRALQSSGQHEEVDAEEQLAAQIDAKRSMSFESIMKSAGKYNKIDTKFKKLKPHTQQIFQHFYREKQFDKSIEQYFGAGLCLVELTPTFKKVDKNIDELKHSIIHQKGVMAKIKEEVKEMYLSALLEYKINNDGNWISLQELSDKINDDEPILNASNKQTIVKHLRRLEIKNQVVLVDAKAGGKTLVNLSKLLEIFPDFLEAQSRLH